MGIYLNPGKRRFGMAVNSEIFIDKTEMLLYVNSVVNTHQRFVCVSRPRRFGKSMAADMLCAYYGKGAGSRELFEKCRVSKINEDDVKWDRYLESFNVIRLVITDFFEDTDNVTDVIQYISEEVIAELQTAYPNVNYGRRINLRTVMNKIYAETGEQFVIIIDEWDALFREYKNDKEGQKVYLDFLRDWLKDKEYIALAYMTGILPIKKYGKHSALNMFDEYSVIQPMQLASYTGFTENEVFDLCKKYGRNFEDYCKWYDGYRVSDIVPPDPEHKILNETGRSPDAAQYRLYSPLSVVKAIRSGEISNYWNETETYEALKQYIDWNFDGLREDVAVLMDGGRIKVDITTYQNDMTTFNSKDDILTMLIHLGYLGYDKEKQEVFIPNQEVLQVFRSSTSSREWRVTFKALENSEKLLKATWNCDEDRVAELIEAAHDRAGNRTYNSEEALSYSIRLAYYSAQEYYTVIPELDTGKGYADLVYIPKTPDKPAILVELKYNKDAVTAITQIHDRNYPDRLEHYKGNIILVGINYDTEIRNNSPEFKHHSCRIERA